MTPFKPSHHLSALDSRYFSFGTKVKQMLKSEDHDENKENQSSGNVHNSHLFEKTRSAIFKRSEMNLK